METVTLCCADISRFSIFIVSFCNSTYFLCSNILPYCYGAEFREFSVHGTRQRRKHLDGEVEGLVRRKSLLTMTGVL